MDEQTLNTPAPEGVNPATAATFAPVETTPDPQAVTMRGWADDDLKTGKITGEQHAGIMAELGFTEQTLAAAPADSVADYLTAEGFPPAKPSELRLRQHFGENMTPELHAHEKNIVGWVT